MPGDGMDEYADDMDIFAVSEKPRWHGHRVPASRYKLRPGGGCGTFAKAAVPRAMAHLLVIDDDLQVRNLMERWLLRAGHTVRSAPNGAAGARLIEDELPDLVITDMLMPQTDGMAFIRALRRTHPDIPVIAISGAISALPMDFPPVGQEFGPLLTLPKPIPMPTLLAAVERLLNARP